MKSYNAQSCYIVRFEFEVKNVKFCKTLLDNVRQRVRHKVKDFLDRFS